MNAARGNLQDLRIFGPAPRRVPEWRVALWLAGTSAIHDEGLLGGWLTRLTQRLKVRYLDLTAAGLKTRAEALVSLAAIALSWASGVVFALQA